MSDPDATVSPKQLVGTTLDASGRQLTLQEEVRQFSDSTQSQAWLSLVKQGFGCAQGDLGPGTTVTITGPQDVTADIGTEEAVAWQLATSDAQMELVLARQDDGVALFLFIGGTGADTSGIPDPVSLAKKGVDKLGS